MQLKELALFNRNLVEKHTHTRPGWENKGVENNKERRRRRRKGGASERSAPSECVKKRERNCVHLFERKKINCDTSRAEARWR